VIAGIYLLVQCAPGAARVYYCARRMFIVTSRVLCFLPCLDRGSYSGIMAATSDHHDVIVIGGGPGSASLAHRLAGAGKRIPMLERGGYLPSEGWPGSAFASRLPRHAVCETYTKICFTRPETKATPAVGKRRGAA
jgi:hypothetical protein